MKGFRWFAMAAALVLSGCVLQIPGVNIAFLGTYVANEAHHTDGSNISNRGAGTFATDLEVGLLSAGLFYEGQAEDGSPLKESLVTGANDLSFENDKAILQLIQTTENLGGKLIELESGALTLRAAAEAAETAINAFRRDPTVAEQAFTDAQLAAMQKMIEDAFARLNPQPPAPINGASSVDPTP